MLKQRVMTAVPLAALVIWLMFQPTAVFVYLLFTIALVAGYEWSLLAGSRNRLSRLVYMIIVGAISALLIYQFPEVSIYPVYAATVFWLIYLLRIRCIEPVQSTGVSPLKLLLGIFLIPVTVVSMWALHASDAGVEWLLFGLSVVWVADIGAYFAGRKYGKRKLAEKISPGKTIEGLFGALLATSLYAVVASMYFELGLIGGVQLVAAVMLITLISVVGDLVESVLKREAGVKDSGTILPGHGGILDRIDSVLAAMPVFAVATHHLFYPVFGG